MATWTNPASFTTGQLVSATNLNTNVVENLKYLKGDGNNVGIGITAGSFKLHVSETADITSGEHGMLFVQPGSSGGLFGGYRSDGAAVTRAFLRSSSTLPLDVGAGAATQAMTILTSGDVGIGDTTPSYKLDVNGTFRAVGAAEFDGTITNAANGKVSGISGRRGGSATVWATNGTTAQTVSSPRQEYGVNRLTLTATSAGTVTPTFQTAFTGAPHMQITPFWVSGTALATAYSWQMDALSTSQFTIALYSNSGGNITVTLDFHWVATGQ